MGVVIIRHNESMAADLSKLVKDIPNNLQKIKDTLGTFMEILLLEKTCLKDKSKEEQKLKHLSEHKEQSIRLKKYLHDLRTKFGEPDVVLVEKQIKVNAISNFITAQIEYEFAEKQLFVVEPSLKNKFQVCYEGRYINFAIQKNNCYAANKAHTVFNLKKYAEIFNIVLPKTKMDDMADAFMMVYAYLCCLYCGLF